MISFNEIQKKADDIYSQAIGAWLRGEAERFFPCRIRANLKLSEVHSENVHDIQILRNNSKEKTGNGYTVLWDERNSRKHGLNNFPVAIVIDSLIDLLLLLEKRSEFQRLERRVGILRLELPELEGWLHRHWTHLIDIAELESLIQVALYLKHRPRPDCFARELPLAIPTKLIQNNRQLLSQWLDILLPDETIDCSCNPKHFEQRYGFKYFRKHMLIRILDRTLRKELGLFTSELSLPPPEIIRMPISNASVLIVENHVTLLTLPDTRRTIAFFGEGNGVTQLFDVPWFETSPLLYWGDLDVQGFGILAMLRKRYAQTKSILMDRETIDSYLHLATSGTGHHPEIPSELTHLERQAFEYLGKNNLRIEQEHILQVDVNLALQTRIG